MKCLHGVGGSILRFYVDNLIVVRFFSAAPHLNINLQMNYWPSLSCNLSECQEPLFDYIASLAVNGAKTARVSTLYFYCIVY